MSVELKLGSKFDLCQEEKRYPDSKVKGYFAAEVMAMSNDNITVKYMNHDLQITNKDMTIKDTVGIHSEI